MSTIRRKKRKLQDPSCDNEIMNQWLDTSPQQLLKNITDRSTLTAIMTKCDNIKQLIQQRIDVTSDSDPDTTTTSTHPHPSSTTKNKKESKSMTKPKKQKKKQTNDDILNENIKLIKATSTLKHLDQDDELTFHSTFKLLDGTIIEFSGQTWTEKQKHLTAIIDFQFPIVKFIDNVSNTKKYKDKKYKFAIPPNHGIIKFAKRCGLTVQDTDNKCEDFVGTVLAICIDKMLDKFIEQKVKNYERVEEIIVSYEDVFDEAMYLRDKDDLEFLYPENECKDYVEDAYKMIEKTHSNSVDVRPFVGMFYYGLKMYIMQRDNDEDVGKTMAEMFRLKEDEIKRHLSQFCEKDDISK